MLIRAKQSNPHLLHANRVTDRDAIEIAVSSALIDEDLDQEKGSAIRTQFLLDERSSTNNEYRNVLLPAESAEKLSPQMKAMLENEAVNLNEKLAWMASKMHRDVVMPLWHRDDNPGVYARRKLNIDGTWKEKQRFNQVFNTVTDEARPFHFLEYAKQNFSNPLELLQQQSFSTVGAAQLQQSQAALAPVEAAQPEAASRRRGRSPRTKKGSSMTMDEKFLLKVQKKPINGLQ